MVKQEFWAIMDTCRDENSEIYFASLEDAVAALPPAKRQQFRAYLSAYLEAAAECIWLDMACKVINGYVSDDSALYFTLWVISLGEAALLKALENPDSLAEIPVIPFGDAEFEFLMSVGALEEEEEYEDWNGDMDALGDVGMLAVGIDGAVRDACRQEIQADIRYKNGDKLGGYDSFEAAMEDIPNVLPRLMQRAQEIGFDWKS